MITSLIWIIVGLFCAQEALKEETAYSGKMSMRKEVFLILVFCFVGPIVGAIIALNEIVTGD